MMCRCISACHHISGTRQRMSCLSCITPSLVVQDDQQGDRQAAGGDGVDIQDKGDDQVDMPATQQHTLAPLQDLGLNSGSTSGQHVPPPASRYASVKPAFPSAFQCLPITAFSSVPSHHCLLITAFSLALGNNALPTLAAPPTMPACLLSGAGFWHFMQQSYVKSNAR